MKVISVYPERLRMQERRDKFTRKEDRRKNYDRYNQTMNSKRPMYAENKSCPDKQSCLRVLDVEVQRPRGILPVPFFSGQFILVKIICTRRASQSEVCKAVQDSSLSHPSKLSLLIIPAIFFFHPFQTLLEASRSCLKKRGKGGGGSFLVWNR